MSLDWSEFGKTLRNDTFAIWFGWSIIVATVIFPMTSMFVSCAETSAQESIEIAKIEATQPDRECDRSQTMKWLVTRGVHPLVARCAILNNPSHECGRMITSLEDEDRSILKDLIANPAIMEVVSGAPAITGAAIPPVRAEYYVKGLDFGFRSPAE